MKRGVLNHKRIFASLAVSALVSTAFIATASPANAAPGDSSCDLSSAGSTPGSSGDPYLLSTEQDMFEMADCVDSSTSNNFFQMQNDIHLNSEWTTFDLDSTNSSGAGFDGDGFTLSGFNSSSSGSNGLFTRVENATIKDFYLEVESLTGSQVGSLAVNLFTSTVTNVHVRASGDISSTGYIGGVFSEVSDSTVTDVSFVSSGKITSSASQFSGGGIADRVFESTLGKLSVIADIDMPGTGAVVGGIAGVIRFDSNETLSGLSYSGNLSAGGSAGGLFGLVYEETAGDVTTLNIDDSSVIGSVNSTTENPGGLVGTLDNNSSGKEITELKTGTSFISAEMKKNGVTTTDGAVVSANASVTTITANTGTFYDTDKANFNVTHSATGKQTTQLKTLSQFTGSSFAMVTLASHLSNPSNGDIWLISSDLNDGFPVLRSAYDSLVYGAPYRPQSLLMTPTSEGFDLTFDEPIFNGGAAITSYEYSTDNGSNWSSLTSTTTSGVVTGEITGLSPETSYPVTVRAMNVIGNSPAAVGATAVTSKAIATTPAPYAGPLVSGMKHGSKASFIANGTETVTFVGERLGDVSAASIGSLPAEIIESLATEFSIRVPLGLTPGTYDLVIESSLGNLTYLDAITIDSSQSTNSVGYGEVSAWTKRISDNQVKVYVKYPTVGEKVRIGHQTGGSGSYESVYVKTTSSETMDGLRVVEGVGTYIVRTIDLEDINRIRVTVGDQELVQVRYNR
jgi:hypothetical protein